MPFTFNAAAPTTLPSVFGGFGATTTAPPALSFGFGSTAKTSGNSLFGGTTTTPSAFGFGATTTTSSGGMFSGFGSKPTTSTGFGGFGGFGTSTATTGFGGFGAKPTTGFGTGSTGLGGSLFGQPQVQQQQQTQLTDNPLSILTSALTIPTLFGDERDAILAKLNQLQALWGTGKAYYASNAQPYVFTPENPFSRFKMLGYSCLPSAKDSDGFVSLDLKHKESYVKENQQQFVESLHKILGSKPTMSINVDGVRNLPGDKCEVIVYVVERQSNGTSRRILATELYSFFSQANIKTQLTTLGVENMLAKTMLSESQLKQFLDNPPLGIDSILWEQAKKDNPDPKNLIPVPMMGFNELLTRLKHQEYQHQQHKRRLNLIKEEVEKLQTSHSTTVAKLAQYKRKHLELGHRVLETMVNLEGARKVGYAIEPEEEQLRIQLESVHAELNSPMQFKGRLNELLSQTRLQSQISAGETNTSVALDDNLKLEIKEYLAQQQSGLQQLISIIKEDFEDLKIIENGLADSMYIPRR